MAIDACLFCSIIERKIPAKIVAENEQCLAFRDINPMADFHVLIIPKVHVKSINELNPDHASALASMALMAQELAQQFSLADDGYRLVINTGARAGQSVFHLHMHMLAGREFSWPPG